LKVEIFFELLLEEREWLIVSAHQVQVHCSDPTMEDRSHRRDRRANMLDQKVVLQCPSWMTMVAEIRCGAKAMLNVSPFHDGFDTRIHVGVDSQQLVPPKSKGVDFASTSAIEVVLEVIAMPRLDGVTRW